MHGGEGPLLITSTLSVGHGRSCFSVGPLTAGPHPAPESCVCSGCEILCSNAELKGAISRVSSAYVQEFSGLSASIDGIWVPLSAWPHAEHIAAEDPDM